MTTIYNALTLNDLQYTGEAPTAPLVGSYTFVAAGVGDSVRLNKVFAGTLIHDSRMVYADLGATTTVSLGVDYVDGSSGDSDTALIPATDVHTAAGCTRTVAVPFLCTHDAWVVAVVGSSQADGLLTTVLDCSYTGPQ